MGSERPENCPVDSFQWRTGGSPGKGVATIEVAERKATIEVAERGDHLECFPVATIEVAERKINIL